jgi:hypothetical protein
MTRRLLVLAMLASLAHCNRDNALEPPVQSHCGDIAVAIDLMAQNYDARATLSDATLNPEQQQNADRRYEIVPFGMRTASSQSLSRDLAFCEHVRRLDEQALRALDRRIDRALAGYVSSAETTDAAKSLHDLSAIALEVSHLPLK